MALTMSEIAEKVNVSQATVSRALSNDPKISKNTKLRIKRVADKLGYRCSLAARSLKLGKTNTIGIIIPDLLNPFYVEFLRALETNCYNNNHHTLVVEFGMDFDRQKECLEQLLDRGCDGVIASLFKIEPVRNLIAEFLTQKKPVFIHGLPKDLGSFAVDGTHVDMSKGIELATSHLAEFGHRNIHLIMGQHPEQDESGRIKGLKNGFLKNELKFTQETVAYRYTGNPLEDGFEATKELLRKHPETTAIMGINDMLTIGILQALAEEGLSVPKDISVIGTDNTWICRHWPSPLTSINQHTNECAKVAVDTVFNQLNNGNWDKPKCVNFSTDLTVRKSTGPARRK